ncbi:MAG: hypothetical protein J2P45_25120, partial [Candidatus Dormibacteraeota bacterium]|nr:hypothetical protein [Candidatus Dormibacteraeota bacterium]
MFYRHSVHIPWSIEGCRAQLLEEPQHWLPEPVAQLAGDRSFEMPVGPGAPAALISKRVELDVGPVAQTGDWLTIPVSWRATGPSELFPTFDGELRLEPVDRAACRLEISGNYEPPLGPVGREIDAALMHNVAQGTIRNFVEKVAARVSNLAADRSA